MKHVVVLRLVLHDVPQEHGSLCSHTQRPLHTSIEGNRVKRGLAFGCLSFWLLFLGRARKSDLLSGRPERMKYVRVILTKLEEVY